MHCSLLLVTMLVKCFDVNLCDLRWVEVTFQKALTTDQSKTACQLSQTCLPLISSTSNSLFCL
jgi:hypothetical protein